jgi:GDP-mannose 6-dehydrogenase
MKVSVFGLGYVGVVTSACLARDGHMVIGCDINAEKVTMVMHGSSPIVELGLSELLTEVIAAGRLSATLSVDAAVAASDISLICVGSPTAPNGSIDLTHVYAVCEQIGAAVARKKSPHTVVIRSTVQPGTTEKCREILRQGAAPAQVHCAFNPEFLREGSAINDYETAPFTVIGTDDPVAETALRQLYAPLESPVIVTEMKIAEMIKYTCNAWHAAKITFANEIGRIAKALGVDGREVMNVVTQDAKLNISAAYLRPGFAFGGSCLPKDVRGLTYLAKTNNVEVPLLSALMPSNEIHIARAVQLIQDSGKRHIGLLGLAFKNGTDDLRESPAVELAERLLGKGYQLKIFDPAVQESKLIGANKQFIETKLPHLSRLLTSDPQELLDQAEVLVITYNVREFRSIIDQTKPSQQIIDLAGVLKNPGKGTNYDGIAW